MLNVPSTMVIESSRAQFPPGEIKMPFKLLSKGHNEVVVIDEVEKVNRTID